MCSHQPRIDKATILPLIIKTTTVMERILFQCRSNVQYPSLFMFISHTTHTQTMVYKTIHTGHKASPALSATYTRASQHACWRTSLHCLIWAYAEKPALTRLQPICSHRHLPSLQPTQRVLENFPTLPYMGICRKASLDTSTTYTRAGKN